MSHSGLVSSLVATRKGEQEIDPRIAAIGRASIFYFSSHSPQVEGLSSCTDAGQKCLAGGIE